MSELIRREDLENWLRTECASIDTYEDKEHVIGRLREDLPTVNQWNMVEDDPPDEKDDTIFCYEWTGISGTVYRETSIISLDELMALGYRPIAWMEMPEPPKEGTHENRDHP